MYLIDLWLFVDQWMVYLVRLDVIEIQVNTSSWFGYFFLLYIDGFDVDTNN